MLKPTKKLALAVEAVCDIAYHGGPDPIQSQDIARRLDLPRRYLEQVMQQLVRAQILKGVRGPRGGYRLARERRRISVGEIVRVVQGTPASDTTPTGTSQSELGTRVIGPFWQDVETELLQRLDRVTVEELCRRAEAAGIESEGRRFADFAI